MAGVISSIFKLVLEVSFKLAPDAIDKGLGVPEVFLEENLKLRSRDWSGALVAAFVLDPSEADDAAKEDGGNWDTFYLCGA